MHKNLALLHEFDNNVAVVATTVASIVSSSFDFSISSVILGFVL